METTTLKDPRWQRMLARHGSTDAALDALLARSDALDRIVLAIRTQGARADRLFED